jgi:hypothetical protein
MRVQRDDLGGWITMTTEQEIGGWRDESPRTGISALLLFPKAVTLSDLSKTLTKRKQFLTAGQK